MKEIAPNIYVSTDYPGVNVGAIVFPEGIIAVDAPTLPQDARAWRDLLVETTGLPILYVVLMDGHADRLLSAGLLEAPIVAVRGAYERASGYTDGFWRSVVDGWVRCHPHTADDLMGVRGTLPEIMFTSDLTLHKGAGELTVQQVSGSAPGSAWIHIRERDVLFGGDTVVVNTPPFLDAVPDSKALLDTLSGLRRARFKNTVIVPGRGPICSQDDTKVLSQYLALARRRMRSLHATGQTRPDLAPAVAEMMSFFSIPVDEHDLVQRRVKAGLDRLYEELRENEDGSR
jgi:glyoxylase-like metal-dependent hydrolase (beta-lactamase superfamily II)